VRPTWSEPEATVRKAQRGRESRGCGGSVLGLAILKPCTSPGEGDGGRSSQILLNCLIKFECCKIVAHLNVLGISLDPECKLMQLKLGVPSEFFPLQVLRC
jgi:hypothetical protein